MKQLSLLIVALWITSILMPQDVLARGGGGGGRGGGGGGRGGGGGGGARPSAGRSPAVSRPASRPAAPAARPSTAKPTAARPKASQPTAGARPATGTKAGTAAKAGGAAKSGAVAKAGAATGARPAMGVANRPSAGQLNDFLDVGTPGGAARPGTLPAGRPSNLTGAVAGLAGAGAAAEFLQGSGARPSTLPAGGNRPAAGNRPAVGDRPGVGERPGAGDRALADNRPGRVENRQQLQENRGERRNEIRDQMHDHPVRDFWSDHPAWGAWAITRPLRWATWAGVTGWVGYGSEPAYYNYGEDVYYQDDSVYYGDQPVATAEEYAQQAEQIATSAPAAAPDQSQWMSLGVFALTPDGQASGPDPTLYLQLAISKQGVINGTLYNSATNSTQPIQGMADKASQRSAWTVQGKTRPLMETGIANLTENTAPALVHFADGQTQQWLMVRLDDPEADKQ